MPTTLLAVKQRPAENGVSSKKPANYEELVSVKETKTAKLLAGSTEEAPDGIQSLPVMKDGNEPPDMLLALLNSPLSSMVDSQQARILGRGLFRGRVGTILVIFDALPETANSLKMVKNA